MGQQANQFKIGKPWNLSDMREVGNAAQHLMARDIGYKPYEGPNYAPFSQNSLNAMAGIRNTAMQGNNAIGSANSFLGDMTSNGGMSQGLLGAMQPMSGIANGQKAIGTGNFQGIYDQAGGPSASEQYLTDMASGKYQNGNPWLMESLQKGAEQIALRSNTAAAGSGRYGSAGAAAGTAGMLGDFYSKPLAAAYESDQNRRLQAAGQIDQARMAGLSAQLGAAQGVAGAEGANIQNQLNASNLQSGFYSQGLNRGISAAQLAPGLNEARYADWNKMLGVGQMEEGKAQQAIDNAISVWNAKQARPWEQLMRMNAIVNGQGQFGGTQISGSNPASMWQQLLGGGMLGLGLMNQNYSNMGNNFGYLGQLLGGFL